MKLTLFITERADFQSFKLRLDNILPPQGICLMLHIEDSDTWQTEKAKKIARALTIQLIQSNLDPGFFPRFWYDLKSIDGNHVVCASALTNDNVADYTAKIRQYYRVLGERLALKFSESGLTMQFENQGAKAARLLA